MRLIDTGFKIVQQEDRLPDVVLFELHIREISLFYRGWSYSPRHAKYPNMIRPIAMGMNTQTKMIH